MEQGSYGKNRTETVKKVRLSAFTPGGYARPHSIEEIMILKNYMRYYNVANLNWNELREWKHTNSIRLSQSVNRRTDNYSGDFYPQKKVKISLNCSTPISLTFLQTKQSSVSSNNYF